MISEKMKQLASNNSVIRAMFEEGQNMAREFGAENVYDFSPGKSLGTGPCGGEGRHSRRFWIRRIL